MSPVAELSVKAHGEGSGWPRPVSLRHTHLPSTSIRVLVRVLVRQYVSSQKGHVLGNYTRIAPDSVLVRKPVKVIVKK